MKTVFAGLALLACASAQPFAVGTPGVVPLGNLLTVDSGAPYNLSLLTTQIAEVQAGIAAKGSFTDADIIHFLTNVECLEGQFDTWGVFGRGFLNDLGLGGPAPGGVRQANLTEATRPFLQEVALNEQGHALFTRQAGSVLPCPVLDIPEGFNALMCVAYSIVPAVGQTAQAAIAARFGSAFDPFMNDQNFVLSVLTLEELGATGNKGLSGVMTNPVLQDGLAGLATSATAQATVERFLLWQLRNTTVEPFGETAQQVFARLSAAVDFLDGPAQDSQGIVNTDPRTIAVPDSFVNLIPTDIQGLTFSRTPAQVIRVVTIGNPNSIGGFFPQGLLGAINSSSTYNVSASGTATPPAGYGVASQESTSTFGNFMAPINGDSPASIMQEYDLTQALGGTLENSSYLTRGYLTATPLSANNANTSMVQVGTPGGSYTYGLTAKAAAVQAAAMAPAMAPTMAKAPAAMTAPFTASAGRKL